MVMKEHARSVADPLTHPERVELVVEISKTLTLDETEKLVYHLNKMLEGKRSKRGYDLFY